MRELPGDAERLAAVLDRLADVQLPGWICWCWPHKPPEAVGEVGEGWLAAWERDRAVYRVTA